MVGARMARMVRMVRTILIIRTARVRPIRLILRKVPIPVFRTIRTAGTVIIAGTEIRPILRMLPIAVGARKRKTTSLCTAGRVN